VIALLIEGTLDDERRSRGMSLRIVVPVVRRLLGSKTIDQFVAVTWIMEMMSGMLGESGCGSKWKWRNGWGMYACILKRGREELRKEGLF